MDFPECRKKTKFMRKTILSTVLSSCLFGISLAAKALTPDEQTFIQKAATSDQAEIARPGPLRWPGRIPRF
jgi:hypothetical protein